VVDVSYAISILVIGIERLPSSVSSLNSVNVESKPVESLLIDVTR
jgi:hypothetical protein